MNTSSNKVSAKDKSVSPDISSKLQNNNYANNIFKYIDKRSDITINEILFYGAEDINTRKQVGLNNLCCIYYVIVRATKTIDICVPSLVSATITDCLITAVQKNDVKIRVAIHRSDEFSNLQTQQGIEVKVINTERLEHEFVLIDAAEHCKDSVAVIGALDYDASRVNCNRDSTILTSERVVVQALKREFDRLWESAPDVIVNKDDNNSNNGD